MSNNDERIAFSYVYDSNCGEGLRVKFAPHFRDSGALLRADILQDAIRHLTEAYDAAVGGFEKALAGIAAGGDGRDL